jgi:GNAT superfamily N-acetyltransferase
MTGADALVIRRAGRQDLAAILELYADDELSLSPAASDPKALGPVFDEIQREERGGLHVATRDGIVVGTFQTTFLRHLTFGGARVVQIEAVVVRSGERGRGVGRAMMEWALEDARARSCTRAQLTSQKRREAAHRFYERLGFVRSHEGMKKVL